MKEMKKFEFLDEKYTRYMFECFAHSTGLNLKGVMPNGKTFMELKGSKECEFCSYVKQFNNEKCEASYKRACEEAVKWKEPYFFRCHAGLVMWAVPIMVKEENLGSLICGQVLLWEMDEYFIEELEEMNQEIEDFDLLIEKANKLGVLSADKSQAVAEMLQVIITYLSKANTQAFSEHQEMQKWRNTMLDEMELRKHKQLKDPFEYTAYIRKEKRVLQYIRTGQRDAVIKLLPTLFSEIYVLSDYELKRVKIRAYELISMISRAIIDGGMDPHFSLFENEKYIAEIESSLTPEEIFLKLNKIVLEFVDNIFLPNNETHRSLLKDAQKYIKSYFPESITISDIAITVGISESYLSHLFKESFNFTVNDYLTRIRIEAAQEMMKNRELTLKEIASKCGFSSQSYFSKIFKKYFAVGPKAYRNQFTEGEKI